jgi:hypothetical protein
MKKRLSKSLISLSVRASYNKRLKPDIIHQWIWNIAGFSIGRDEIIKEGT